MSATEYRVGRLAATDLLSLAAFRAREGWLLCPDGAGHFWLKAPAADEESFRKLPLTGRWTGDREGRLIRDGGRVPEALLPAEGWRPVATELGVTPAPRGLPGMPPPAVRFRLERDEADLPAAALICRREIFSQWAETAFAPRLDSLRFACCEDGRAFVTGDPLPPLPGAGFHRLGRLWLPCGYRLPDHVWPELLEEVLGLGRNRLTILHPDGRHEELDEENLAPATRAAVRITERGMTPLF